MNIICKTTISVVHAIKTMLYRHTAISTQRGRQKTQMLQRTNHTLRDSFG